MTAGVGIKLGLLEEAVTASVWISSAAPELMPDKLTVCRLVFSLTVTLASVFRVGAWLTGLTMTAKERETTLLLAPPSSTVTVIVAEPKVEATGVKVIEPVVPGLA